MGGGLLQLVAHGAQDAYLSGNPQITFWKGMFKRHTNFAMEPFRVNLTGVPMWGQKQTATLNRHADLLYSTYLEVVLPQYQAGSSTIPFAWNNEQGRLGYMLLQYAELEIGGQLVDRKYGEYMYLWDSISSTVEESIKKWELVSGSLPVGAVNVGAQSSCVSTGTSFPGGATVQTGRAAKPRVLYIPLEFFYTRNAGAALPLIALQYHEVKINLLWSKAEMVAGDYNKINVIPSITSAAIYIDYIYLDVDERRRMAQESHEYLIEQVQFNEDKGISTALTRIDLTFNHPVKELLWVVQPTNYRTCKVSAAAAVGRPNTQTPVYVLNAAWSYSATTGGQTIVLPIANTSGIVTGHSATIAGLTGGTPNVVPVPGSYVVTAVTANTNISILYTGTTTTTAGPTAAGTVQVTENRLRPFTYDLDAIFEQRLQINGQDRLDRRYGDYFNSTQLYQHHTGWGNTYQGPVSVVSNVSGAAASVSPVVNTTLVTPYLAAQPGIYAYSFSLKPEEHQPSGTCNFSRIDTATILMQLDGAMGIDEQLDYTWGVRVYAINYNILRIMSGMAGLAYSN